MSYFKASKRFVLLLFLIVLNSCVKDVDVQQARDIVIPPTAAVDIVYFTLTPSDFFPAPADTTVVADDEVRLEFLDDDYIRSSLTRADFNFVFSNSFPQEFTSTIRFLSPSNNEKYMVQLEIPPGEPGAPVFIDYTEIIEGDRIQAIRESIKMVIEIKADTASMPVEGELVFKSKAFLKFEFE